MSIITNDREATLARMLNASYFPIHLCILFLCVVLGLKSATATLLNTSGQYDLIFLLETCVVLAVSAAVVYSGLISARASSISSSPELAKGEPMDKIPTAARGNLKKLRANVHNFSAGPACCFDEVLMTAQAEFLNYKGSGMNFMEFSHRDAGGPVQTLMQDLVKNLRELLEVPDNYHVLFFQGGAHMQFAGVPLNLIGTEKKPKADFIMTGVWSKKTLTEHSKYVETHVAYNAEDDDEVRIRDASEWNLSPDSTYVHFTMNETMSGLEFLEDPDVGDRILCCDATSTLLSRPVDISKYGCIYASAGKNLGPAGAAVVIVRDDLLDRARPDTPGIMHWASMARSSPIPNVYNTPPTFMLYMMYLTTEQIKSQWGTLQNVEKTAIERSDRIYNYIDSSDGFYVARVEKKFRSRMNACFRIKNDDRKMEDLFVKEAEKNGLQQLFGHPLMGGLRITAYNQIHDESVDAVLAFMKKFAEEHR